MPPSGVLRRMLSLPCLGVLAFLFLLAACTTSTPTPLPTTTAIPTQLSGSPAPAVLPEDVGLPSIASVVKHVMPAVVSVNTQTVTMDLFFRMEVPGAGTGAIIRSDGYIVTNNHVLEGAREIIVNLPDGRVFPAEVVGRDPEGDLAVIKIDVQDLPTMPFGSSEELQVGDWVVALGNALGLKGGPTVTIGIVSALGRTILTDPQEGTYLYDTIQTDAAINQGNSGGPLVNLKGELVGINTAIQGDAQGIGFAIASRTVEPVVASLIETGRVVRPLIGIRTATLTPAIARQLRVGVSRGVVVAQVFPGTPASRAGLQDVDIIVKVNGQLVEDDAEFRRVLWQYQPGDTIMVEFVRGRETRTAEVTLDERPPSVALGQVVVA